MMIGGLAKDEGRDAMEETEEVIEPSCLLTRRGSCLPSQV